jgi:hypothetical protein
VLLKHRQGGFWEEGNLCVHGVTHSVRILTDGSGETASTPKIVSDVARTSTCRCMSRPTRLRHQFNCMRGWACPIRSWLRA